MRIAMFTAACAVLALSACGKPAGDNPAATSSPSATASETTADAGGKPAAFAQCMACHSTVKGQHGVGPSLAGVYGTKSGEIPGYAFSDALKNAQLTWDDATLDKWLANPMKLVPGTRMTFAGMSDAAKRKELIDYLKTLK